MATWLAPDAFLDTNAHLAWRHSRDVRRCIEASFTEDNQVQAAFHSYFSQYYPPANEPVEWTRCGNSLEGIKEQIDLSFFTTTGATFFELRRSQAVALEEFIGLFRSAVEGKAFSTQHQFQSLLNFLDVDPTFERQRRIFDSIDIKINRQVLSDFVISDGQHRPTSVSDLNEIWIDIDTYLSQTGPFGSLSEVLEFVRSKVSAKLTLRSRCIVKCTNLALTWAPSTYEWVHDFVLWTGISPPAEASETDAIGVSKAQRPNLEEDYRDFLFRQENRPGGARKRRKGRSERSSRAGGSANRHFVSSRNFGRGAFRRSWPNCQDASHQAAEILPTCSRSLVDRI
jgi:hypothetical protein